MSAQSPRRVARSPALKRRGVLLILASPSGAGKSTLSRLLLDDDGAIGLSISVTTRERRPSEVEGVHYDFVTPRRFETMRDGGELLEWAEVHGYAYGTPREPVETAMTEGRDLLFDVDYQGTLQLYETLRDDIVSVFILPPSAAELRARLNRRADTAPDLIARRLENARVEIAHWAHYNYVIVNDDVQDAFVTLKAILAAERAKRVSKDDLGAFVAGLDAELAALSG